MSTGIESWNVNLLDIGPMYPFVGTETALAVVGIVAWIAWHVVQARIEAREIALEEQKTADAEFLIKTIDREQDA